jgi:uncharacterized protein YggE
MSTSWQVVSIITLAAVVFTLGAVLFTHYGTAAASAARVAATGGVEQTGITISAQGEVKAKPDQAHISLGVRTSGETARETMDKNNAAIAAVIAKLEALGVAKKDMQTGSISLYPQTQQVKGDDPNQIKIIGYWANNTLNVTFNDLAKAGAILDAAISAGANSVSGISFDVQDDAKLKDQALAEAVKTARAKADLVAAGLGLKVTGVQSVSAESYGGPSPVSLQYGGAVARDAASSVPIEGGELTYTASVRVTFSF